MLGLVRTQNKLHFLQPKFWHWPFPKKLHSIGSSKLAWAPFRHWKRPWAEHQEASLGRTFLPVASSELGGPEALTSL